MTELYRGLLYILTTRFNNIIETFRTHIRSFNPQTTEPDNYLDVGVFGFWNLVLEIIFTLFTILCLVAGIAMLILLAVVSYPFEAMLTFSSRMVGYTRNPPDDFLEPVVIKLNDKEEKK